MIWVWFWPQGSLQPDRNEGLTNILRCDQNKLMSKKLSFIISSVSFLMLASLAYGAPLLEPGQGFVAPTGNKEQSISSIVTLVTNGLFIVATILAVVYLLIGGIRWITSKGDKMAVEAARKQIVAAVIGLVVVAAAFLIINVVFNLLGTNNPLKGDSFQLPTLQNPNPQQ